MRGKNVFKNILFFSTSLKVCDMMCRVDSTPTNLIKFCGLFDTWRLFFFAYEGFWKFFVFRRRKNGCASRIIFGRNRVILFGVAFMKSTYDETESQSAQQFRRYIFRIVLRLVLDLFSIDSRSVLDRSSINLRSFFVHSPFVLRFPNGARTEIERRMNGG